MRPSTSCGSALSPEEGGTATAAPARILGAGEGSDCVFLQSAQGVLCNVRGPFEISVSLLDLLVCCTDHSVNLNRTLSSKKKKNIVLVF